MGEGLMLFIDLLNTIIFFIVLAMKMKEKEKMVWILIATGIVEMIKVLAEFTVPSLLLLIAIVCLTIYIGKRKPE